MFGQVCSSFKTNMFKVCVLLRCYGGLRFKVNTYNIYEPTVLAGVQHQTHGVKTLCFMNHGLFIGIEPN